MGGADFTNVLYSSYLINDPDDPKWFVRDKFFLDPGHMSPMLYSILFLSGKYTLDDIKAFRSLGSITPGHPELDPAHGIENTSGPLGQGQAMAVGCAIAERFFATHFSEVLAHKTYAFISDGSVQEGISQEAARIAGHLGLSNLIMFYDSNEVQLSTDCDEVSNENTAMKYKAWNWNVIEVNGSDPLAIADAIEMAQAETQRPTLIIGHTIMGRGCVTADGKNFEGQCSTHGQPLSKSGASYEKTVENLGGNVADPWAVFPEVAELYKERAKELRKIVAQRKERIAEWQKANPELAQKLQDYIDGKMADVDYASIQHKPDIATRSASADVLSVLGEKVGNMIVSSADLANSDKTDAFLKKVGAFAHHDFKGAFLHAGVSELAMTSIMNGIVRFTVNACPATVEANLYVRHNRPDATLKVTLHIYDLMGREVWSSTQSGRSDMFRSFPITWNLCDASGSRVPRGIYVCRASVSTDGVQEATKAVKIAVAGE